MLALLFLVSLHLGATSGEPVSTQAQAQNANHADHERLRTALAPALAALMADSAFKGANVGVAIARAGDSAELFSHDGDRSLVPASNVKIISTAAALSTLSPDFQFATDVFGTLRSDGRIDGNLTFKGYGDPYLLPERVWYLCNRLRFLGIREVTGDLVVDDSYFAGERMANGWEEDTSSNAYMAPAGALSIGFNAMLIHMYPGAKANEPGTVALEPATHYPPIVGQLETTAHGRTSVHAETIVQDGGEALKVSGHMHVGDSPRGLWRRVTEPSLFAGNVLRETLAQVGITVHGRVRVGPAVPAPRLLRFESPRLAEILGPLNKYSNNFMASQLAFTLGAHTFGAPGTWDKGRLAIEQFLNEQVRLKPGSYKLRNASGLHEVNLFSARQMVQVLTYMVRQPQVWPEFINSLAVAGGTGTLKDRMQHTQALHILRGKTGTLAGACALSGYVPTRDGTLLAFSIIVNGFQRVRPVWAAQDRLADMLAGLDLSSAQPHAVTTGPALSTDSTTP